MNNFKSYFFLISYLVVGFIPNLERADPAGVQAFYLTVISFLHIFSILIFNKKREKVGVDLITVSFITLIILAFISILDAYNKTESLVDLARYILYFLIFINLKIEFENIDLKDFVNKLSFFFVGILIVENIYLLIDFSESFSYNKYIEWGRNPDIKGTAANINITAFSLVSKLSFVVYFLISNRYNFLFKLFLSLLFFSTIFCVSLTGSRGGLLGIYLIMFVTLVSVLINFNKKKEDFLKLSFLFLPYFINLFVTSLIFKTLSVSYRTVEIIRRGSASRIKYYKDALNAMLDHPFNGVGVGNWKIFSILYDKENILDYVVPKHAHNDILQVGAELGIIGLIVVLFLIFYISRFFINTYFKNNKLPIEYLPLLLLLTIYLLDSSLNFPIDRPIMVIPFIVVLAIISSKSQIQFKWNRIQISIISIIFIIPTSYAIYKVDQSLKDQFYILYHYNKNTYEQSNYNIAMNYEEDFPSLTVTAMPLKTVKATYIKHHKGREEAIEYLKKIKKSDNPFLGFEESLLGDYYNGLEKFDSAYKYSKIAYSKIKQNTVHSANLIYTLMNLEKTEELMSVFNEIKHLKRFPDWQFTIKYIRDNESKFPKDTISKIVNQALEFFPDASEFDIYQKVLENEADIILIANQIAEKGNEYFLNNDYSNAFLEYQKASSLIPKEYAYRENMILCKLMLEKYDEVIELSIQTRDEIPIINNGKLELYLSISYFEKGKIDFGCQELIISINKGNLDAKNSFYAKKCGL